MLQQNAREIEESLDQRCPTKCVEREPGRRKAPAGEPPPLASSETLQSQLSKVCEGEKSDKSVQKFFFKVKASFSPSLSFLYSNFYEDAP